MKFSSENELARYVLENPTLRSLKIEYSHEIRRLPKLPDHLLFFKIERCDELAHLGELPATLIDLEIVACDSLIHLPVSLSCKLRRLLISSCDGLNNLPAPLSLLENLRIYDCPNLDSLPDLTQTSLQVLEIMECFDLTGALLLPQTTTAVTLIDCLRLERIQFSKTLKSLTIQNCPALVKTLCNSLKL
jgi:hypothetical protein